MRWQIERPSRTTVTGETTDETRSSSTLSPNAENLPAAPELELILGFVEIDFGRKDVVLFVVSRG